MAHAREHVSRTHVWAKGGEAPHKQHNMHKNTKNGKHASEKYVYNTPVGSPLVLDPVTEVLPRFGSDCVRERPSSPSGVGAWARLAVPLLVCAPDVGVACSAAAAVMRLLRFELLLLVLETFAGC